MTQTISGSGRNGIAAVSSPSARPSEDEDNPMNWTSPCIMDGGVCRSIYSPKIPGGPCSSATEEWFGEKTCPVLPDNITAQSSYHTQQKRKLPERFQSLAARVHLKMEEHYRLFRQKEIQDFQRDEQVIASLKTVRDRDLPDAVVPIMQSMEESAERHFELGIALDAESTELANAVEARLTEVKNARRSESSTDEDRDDQLWDEERKLSLFSHYWKQYRSSHTERIFLWFNNRMNRWNHAFGYTHRLPKITNLGSEFVSYLWRGITRGAIQGDYFTPSNLTERIGSAIGQITLGFTPAGIVADIRDLTAAVGTARREGFSWSTASGILLAGIGLMPGAGDAAKALGKLAKESLAASKSRGVIRVAEAMKQRAADYQTKITGLPAGQAYELNGVKFDGIKDGILLEAKGPGYQNFVKYGKFAKWWEKTGLERLLEQAKRQQDAAQGSRIQWHFSEPGPAGLIKKLFKDNTINIEVIFTP